MSTNSEDFVLIGRAGRIHCSGFWGTYCIGVLHVSEAQTCPIWTAAQCSTCFRTVVLGLFLWPKVFHIRLEEHVSLQFENYAKCVLAYGEHGLLCKPRKSRHAQTQCTEDHRKVEAFGDWKKNPLSLISAGQTLMGVVFLHNTRSDPQGKQCDVSLDNHS